MSDSRFSQILQLIAIFSLSAAGATTTICLVVLTAGGHDVPPVLAALCGSAIGGLAGFLSHRYVPKDDSWLDPNER